ncbi:hypothetical protein [Acanthopleuribacter pedis]|uniref:Uncharacterized protein n=1 Tax=Acanthopleuribacter pedis TaxID=442870 RepID=A0A8J7QDH2_9BACT|nr:hypothetical protein [Acanthopleuribacter pedis]MBO1322527.1 hypothetical protein [Acanthopleuribacter pedis]
MGHDYVGFANRTRKEYIRPLGGGSTSNLDFMMRDPFLAPAALHLITVPHHFFMPEGDTGVLYPGIWARCDYFWVSDYDEAYDCAQWDEEWTDVTADAFVMLLAFPFVGGVDQILEDLTTSKRTLITIGDIYEKTKSKAVEKRLIDAFGKAWSKWYYDALAHRFKATPTRPKIKELGK